jgi:hypothetical protein
VEHVAPLLETALWVGLIGFIFWKYGRHVDSILDAIRSRIEAGDSIKIASFELRPQDPQQQQNNLDKEVAEILDGVSENDGQKSAGAAVDTSPSSNVRSGLKSAIRSKYIYAEDLALRQIQSEYGVPISRQLQMGSDLQFDGFFAREGKGHAVEVKYTVRTNFSMSLMGQVIDKFFSRIGRYGWKNVTLILAVVYDNESVNLVEERERILRNLSSNPRRDQIEVRCYTLSQLANNFGIDVPMSSTSIA